MQIGQHVLCIRDDWLKYPRFMARHRKITFPIKGKVYTVRELFILESTRMPEQLRLQEIINPVQRFSNLPAPLERGFPREFFRPLTRITVETFLKNVAPLTPELVE